MTSWGVDRGVALVAMHGVQPPPGRAAGAAVVAPARTQLLAVDQGLVNPG